ncbi:MAG: cation:proton antiporter [Calditrichaeota bacterium]|nr:cation:proton antiporter [Calditrichota bacterium]
MVIIIRAVLQKTVVPALVGFIILGFLLNLADSQWAIFGEESHWVFRFLAKIGIITLLFRIGLESNVRGLLSQLKKASFIWIGGVVLSAAFGFITASSIFNIELIPSIFVAVALTATSVGVPVGVWQEAGALQSERGELLIDTAELDDISGIILMVLLFAVAPVLKESGESGLFRHIGEELLFVIIKFTLFTGFCLIFSLYLERHITEFMGRYLSQPNVVLLSLGFGLLIASGAAYLGFSVAIGAFFAGVAFSRDPKRVQMDSSFRILNELFSPFFFIGIGLNITTTSLLPAVGLGTALFLAAGAGKIIGHGTPAYILGGWTSFLLIGISMVPRAEITMIITERGLNLGNWAVTNSIFTAMVLVCLATCLLAPVVIKMLLRQWPQNQEL